MAFIKRLQGEFKEYLKNPSDFYSIEVNEKNFFSWDILILGPPETIFEGGIFKCNIIFTSDYPNKPPQFKFITKLFHPNIYPDGKVCISILHEGHDQWEYESISERWNPSHSVNSIIMSILSILTEPNFESPANVDASIMWQKNFINYKKIIYETISHS